MSRACWHTSCCMKQLQLFRTVDEGKLCPPPPPHLKGNINRPITFINCAIFPKIRLENVFPLSTIEKFHAEIVFVAGLRDRSWEVKNVYLFFQDNASRKFLNLLLCYLPVFWLQYRLQLPLFSLNVMAFACTCEPVGIQLSFEFLCLVLGWGV